MEAKRFRVLRPQERDGKALIYQVDECKVTFETPTERRKGYQVDGRQVAFEAPKGRKGFIYTNQMKSRLWT